MIFKPHAYQQHCIDRIIDQPAVGLFLDMGLGKTAITLHAIKELKLNRFQIGKVLVVAPLKVAEATWTEERQKWRSLKNIRISRVLGTKAQREKALRMAADIYIINRENIPWLADHYRSTWPFDMVVLDESTSFKNPQSKRFKAMKSVLPYIKRMVLLTGTPSPNGAQDLWAQIYLLDQGARLERNITRFRNRYMYPEFFSGGYPRSYAMLDGAEEVIQEKIGDLCISMTADDYLELPELTIQDVPVQLDSKARKAYDTMQRQMILELDSGEIDATSAAVLSGKLLQLANGAVYDEHQQAHEIHRCKIDAFLETIEQLNGKPAIVYYSYRHDRQRIIEALKPTGLRVRELKTKEDQDQWNRREIDVLLAHPASAGYGLNLQAGGNHIIWFGLTYNLEQYLQANKRLHRQGQDQAVIVHRIIAKGTRDEDVAAAIEHKGDRQQHMIDSLKATIEATRLFK